MGIQKNKENMCISNTTIKIINSLDNENIRNGYKFPIMANLFL